jgi:hypothetical protein
MKKAHTEKPDAKRPLNREELQLAAGGDGGLLAFPFIQQAMQGTVSPVEPL